MKFKMDKLDQIFDKQTVLYNRFRKVDSSLPLLPVNLSTKENQRVFRNCALDLIEELMEAIHELKNKSHRQTDVVHYNETAFKEELVDTATYLFELLILADYNAEKFYSDYSKKNAINHMRIEGGY